MYELSIIYFIYGFLGAALISLIAWRLKALTVSGAIGAVIIGAVVFGFDTVSRGAPLIYFFVSSSILSAIKTKRKKEAMTFSEKTGPRDFWQVMANGGLGAMTILIARFGIFEISGMFGYFTYVILFAIATADTWATEIGTLSPETPHKMLILQRVKPGESGGMTVIGSVAAFIGAATLMIVTSFVSSLDSVYENTTSFRNILLYALIAGIIGLIGSLIDSFLGSYYQAEYYCEKCQSVTENKTHCGVKAELVQGVAWVNNDMVNFLSQAFIFIPFMAIAFKAPPP